MKKSEILGLSWLRTEEVPVCGKTVTIRELPASARQDVFAELRRMREAESPEPEINDYFISELVFRSVVDEDGVVVFESEEDRAVALNKEKGFPSEFFSVVYAAVDKLNEITSKVSDDKGQISEDTKKKSEPTTEASSDSCGSEDLPENSGSAA
jgi:hypothetical protein